jgi:hypothetical protein
MPVKSLNTMNLIIAERNEARVAKNKALAMIRQKDAALKQERQEKAALKRENVALLQENAELLHLLSFKDAQKN